MDMPPLTQPHGKSSTAMNTTSASTVSLEALQVDRYFVPQSNNSTTAMIASAPMLDFPSTVGDYSADLNAAAANLTSLDGADDEGAFANILADLAGGRFVA